MTNDRIDPEWLGLKAGLRPAIRLTVEPSWVEEVSQVFTKMDATVLQSEGTVVIDHRTVQILYIGRDEEVLKELRTAEWPLFDHPEKLTVQDKIDRHRIIGRCLGFPSCCVEAFCAWSGRGVGTLEAGGPIVASEPYVSAYEARVPSPNPLLNDQLEQLRLRLITFSPCSYTCEAASTFASKLFKAIEDFHGAEPAQNLLAQLSRPTAIGKDGQRAWIHCSSSAPHTIEQAEALPGPEGRPPDSRDVDFAASLKGARINPDGLIEGAENPAPLCLFFARAP
jgi:hypothetical protein